MSRLHKGRASLIFLLSNAGAAPSSSAERTPLTPLFCLSTSSWHFAFPPSPHFSSVTLSRLGFSPFPPSFCRSFCPFSSPHVSDSSAYCKQTKTNQTTHRGGGEAKETLTHRREEVTPKKRHRPLSSAPPPTTRLFVFIYLFILFLFILLVVAFESLPLLVVHAVPERRGQKAALFFFLPLYPVLLYPILILLRLLLLGVCTRALNLRLSFSLYSVWLFLWCFSSFLHSPCRSVGFFL